jgi:hypothetical protein
MVEIKTAINERRHQKQKALEEPGKVEQVNMKLPRSKEKDTWVPSTLLLAVLAGS